MEMEKLIWTLISIESVRLILSVIQLLKESIIIERNYKVLHREADSWKSQADFYRREGQKFAARLHDIQTKES